MHQTVNIPRHFLDGVIELTLRFSLLSASELPCGHFTGIKKGEGEKMGELMSAYVLEKR